MSYYSKVENFMGNAMDCLHKEQCPCWLSDHNGECTITEGGVYIPLPQHILMFCQSSSYIHCSRYIRMREIIINKEIVERRKISRYAKYINIDINVCNSANNLSAQKKYKAKILDVSLYGMKIECPEQVETATTVGFKLDAGFPSEILTGYGSVKWCEQQADSGKFEFGMAFSDDPAIEKGIRKLLYMQH